jgi:hypothetical protein
MEVMDAKHDKEPQKLGQRANQGEKVRALLMS